MSQEIAEGSFLSFLFAYQIGYAFISKAKTANIHSILDLSDLSSEKVLTMEKKIKKYTSSNLP